MNQSGVIKVLVVVMYLIASNSTTFTNKVVFSSYKFESPLMLLFVQCCINMIICVSLITYKSRNVESLKILDDFGLKLSTW